MTLENIRDNPRGWVEFIVVISAVLYMLHLIGKMMKDVQSLTFSYDGVDDGEWATDTDTDGNGTAPTPVRIASGPPPPPRPVGSVVAGPGARTRVVGEVWIFTTDLYCPIHVCYGSVRIITPPAGWHVTLAMSIRLGVSAAVDASPAPIAHAQSRPVAPLACAVLAGHQVDSDDGDDGDNGDAANAAAEPPASEGVRGRSGSWDMMDDLDQLVDGRSKKTN